MTAIQGGGQRLSDSTLNLLTDSSDITQTLLMGGLLLPTTLSTARWPLLEPHKATGGATTQTRTTDVLPTPPIERCKNADRTLYSSLTGPEDLIYPEQPNGLWMETGPMCLVNRLWFQLLHPVSWSWDTGGFCVVYDCV